MKNVVKSVMNGLCLLILIVLLGVMVYSLYLSRPLFDEKLTPKFMSSFKVAAPRSALTFARYEDTGAMKLLLVTGIGENELRGVDLSAVYGSVISDPRVLYNTVSYDALAILATRASSASTEEAALIVVSIDNLILPMDFTYPHIAAGTNYADHAEEVYVDDPPFLFPKLAHATQWNASINADSSSHLDYEAEICMVPLVDIPEPGVEVTMGLILCNDYTDRWTLLKEIDLDEPMGVTGFAAAKGKPGYLTVGYLLVIPRSPEFYRDIGFQLYVNDGMRQNVLAKKMILTPTNIIRETFVSAQQDYFRDTEKVSLLPHRKIPAGTLLLTGTAGGVIFKPLNAWNPLLYLKRGDRVITVGDYLGHLDNRIR
jgi:2,4-diketo-3-deoxy-L-fuconate hydrolase